MQFWLDLVREIVVTAGVPIALILAGGFLAALQRHGFRTAYAAGVLKAVGEGQNAAQAAGTTLFTPLGRSVAIAAGAKYLMATLPTASAALGIVEQVDHEARVASQIGLMQAEAEAQARAMAAVAPTPLPSVVPSLTPRS